MVTNEISTEISLQGNVPFFLMPDTIALLISRVCIYKRYLFILIYILRRGKFKHTPDNAHLFYIIAFISVFFSIDEIQIFIIIIIYDLIADGWRIHVSGI